jgi:hypothetical protein
VTPRAAQQKSRARRAALGVACGLVLVVIGSATRVALYGKPWQPEPDWPLVFKGFSEALSSDGLAKLEQRAAAAGAAPALMNNAIALPEASCMAQVDECLDNRTLSLADVNIDRFFQRLDDCLARAAKCAFDVEAAEADKALAAANVDLLAAVSMLETGAKEGVEKLNGAIKGASAAVAREFPSVAAFMRSVAERVLAYLRRNLPLWIAAAKEIGGVFGEQLLRALEVLQERLPGVAQQCKCGLAEGAKAVKEASAEAAALLRAELPRWTAEAKKAGQGAILFAEGLLADVPKVVDMCKTELEKQIAKDGKKVVIQKALVVGAALGAVGIWMHHQHTQTQARAAELIASTTPSPEVTAERRSLRVKASESQKQGWPAEHMLASAYRNGLWESFGRQAARILEHVDNITTEEYYQLFPSWN